MVSRITLRGATPLHAVLERPDVLADLRKHLNDSYPLFFCDALVDGTTDARDKEALRREGLFPAVFLQAAAAQRSDPDQAVAFLQDEFLAKNIQLPGSCVRSVAQLAAEAEDLVLDLLAQGDER